MHCYIKVEKRSGIKHFISTQHVALLYILFSHNSQMGWYFLSWLIIRCHIENFFSWRLARLCLNGNSYFCQQTKNCAIYFLSSYAGWNHKFEELLCILITIFVNWASCLLRVFGNLTSNPILLFRRQCTFAEEKPGKLNVRFVKVSMNDLAGELRHGSPK